MASPILSILFGNSMRQVSTRFMQGFLGSEYEKRVNEVIEYGNTSLKTYGYNLKLPKYRTPPSTSVSEIGGSVVHQYLSTNGTYIKAKLTQLSLGPEGSSEGLNTFVKSTEDPFNW